MFPEDVIKPLAEFPEDVAKGGLQKGGVASINLWPTFLKIWLNLWPSFLKMWLNARNYIGTFGHIWPNGVFIINAGGLYLLLCTFPYRVKGHLHDYMRSHSGT